jgi:uncharacterized protein DUF4292
MKGAEILKHYSMHKFLAGFVMVVILAGIGTGCRSTKKIRKVMNTSAAVRKDTIKVETQAPPENLKADSIRFIQQTLQGLYDNRINFQTFSARMKVHYEAGDGKDVEFNAFIRIQKDSMIWISVNAGLGIEAFRVLITPDSVKILDKLKKVARLRSVNFLREAIHLPIDFKTFQDLLMGNPVYLDSSNIVLYKQEPNAVSLLSIGSLFKNYLTLNAGDKTMRHSKLDNSDPLKTLSCDLTYGDYEQQQRDNSKFSTYRKISVAEKFKLDIELGIKQYKFNEILSFPFPIPKNYKRK